MKPSHAVDENLFDRTRKIWQPRIGRDLTNEDARQINENVTGSFTILAEWSQCEDVDSNERPERTDHRRRGAQ